MHDDIMQVVIQLEKKGVAVAVGCSHLGWLVSTVKGDEIIRYHSAREVYSFLAGLLFGTTTMAQQLNA
jgi:hypothetical protein